MKLISIVTPCLNEEDNVTPLYEQIDAVFASLPQYSYELIFIDNDSDDRTVERIKAIAERDKRVKLIVNARNFGQVRSPYHALMQARGDAIIGMCCDLQDPPDLIPAFLGQWENGHKIVIGVKEESHDSRPMWAIRQMYYRIVHRIADVKVIPNFTGYGLYDRSVVEIMRRFDDPYPYFRGVISEIGFETATIPFKQPKRKRGITKNNFYSLYDLAMLGITSHSKVPLRLATMAGFSLSLLSLLVAIGYLIAKLMYWESFSVGMAPILIGLFFFASVQLFFIGILGEYIGSIHTRVLKRPLVVEKERVNFND